MDRNAIKDLYVHAFRNTTPDVTNFSVKDVKESARQAMKELAPNRLEFHKNKYDIFAILQESFDEVVPEYVDSIFNQFAEVRQVADGTKASFRIKRGRNRAKTFITQVGLSGTYEAFRLDVDAIDVKANAWGGAAYIDFERSLDGSEDVTEPLELLLEGLQLAIQREVVSALIATIENSSMPTANYVITTGFDPEQMARLCTIAKNYGGGNAVIFATPEFIQKMGPDAIGMPIYGIGGTNAQGQPIAPIMPSVGGYATPVYAPQDINDIHVLGHITMFRGVPIVEIAQSFTDDENDTYLIPPSFAYVFPAGDQKIVKVVFEGDTQIDEWNNPNGHRDRSIEIEVYKKFGVAILTTNTWCAYRNLELETSDYKTYNYLSKRKNPHNFA